MVTFNPVNTGLTPEPYRHHEQEKSPTTPRPSTASNHPPPNRSDDAATPTKSNFGPPAGQRPLPAEPFPAAVTFAENPEKGSLQRGDSHHSARSRDSGDVDMDMDGSEGEDDSDEESVAADGTRTKKKKSQRFWCTDYPPCNLSFTRSEHLARHIRKHTGERPFQCHCQRRFSRLDNLRQHAQTVHVNEDIPNDSLAASGTRFQRTIRTDRARPPGSRSRASTAGSQTGSVRGHRHSLSASSVGSMASYTSGPDARRRPPPLVMADRGPRLSGEMERPYTPSTYQYRTASPGFNTPTSATFSTGPNSPRWGSAMQSPASSHSRTQSLYNGHRTPGRRLSVPSAQNPFQSPNTGYGPAPLGMSNAPYSPSLASPTSPADSNYSRRDSVSSVTDDGAWRRRTWHPDSAAYASFTTRLQNAPTYYASGPPPQAPVIPSNAPPLSMSSNMRLPGIESFDPIPHTQSPVRRQPSPMMIDPPNRPPQEAYGSRPTSQHWDRGIPQELNRLDITQRTPPVDAASWASEANRAVQAQAEVVRAQPQQVRFEESPYSARSQQAHFHHQSAPPITPRGQKRQAWYNGPVTPVTAQHSAIDPRLSRTSPEDSSSSEGVPGTPHSVSIAELHPSIMHSNGYVEHRNGMPAMPPNDPRIIPSNAPVYQTTYQPREDGGYAYNHSHGQSAQAQGAPKRTDGMSALDTLVAVATSGDNIVGTAY